MFSVARKTQKWVENGLITDEQARRINAFEQSRKSFLSLFSILMFLGFFSIALGVAAVVASNWADIPDAVKLVSMFVLLTACAAGSARVRRSHPAAFTGGMLFYAVLLFAAIGLVGQIYHIKSDTYAAFLFWSVLAFPPVLLMNKGFAGYVWDFIFVLSLSCSPWGVTFWRRVVEWFETPMQASFLFFALFFALLKIKGARVFVAPLRAGAFALCAGCLMDGGLNTDAGFPFAPLIAAAVFALFVAADKNDPAGRRLLWGGTGLYAVSFLLPVCAWTAYLSQLAVLLYFIFAAYHFGGEKTARLLGVLTACRILTVWLSLFGSLLNTGAGLIVSGMFILAIACGCYKGDKWLKKMFAKGGVHAEILE